MKSLYQRLGWEHVPALRVTFGEAEPKQLFNDGHVMTLFVSDAAAAHDFDPEPIHVGPNTW